MARRNRIAHVSDAYDDVGSGLVMFTGVVRRAGQTHLRKYGQLTDMLNMTASTGALKTRPGLSGLTRITVPDAHYWPAALGSLILPRETTNWTHLHVLDPGTEDDPLLDGF